MSEPSQFTAQQASDPATPAEVLAAIAEHRPDLRPAVAGNPTAYPGLLAWLGQLGDPAVDAALAARAGGPAAAVVPPVEPVAQAPATDPLPAAPETVAPDQGFAAPGYAPPVGQAYQPPAAAEEPYQAPAYGQPVGYPPAGGVQGPYGAPPPGVPGGPYGAPAGPYGAPPPGVPGGPYGAPAGPYGAPPPKKRSLTWLWILLGVIAVLVIGGIILAVFVVRNVADQIGDVIPSFNSDAQTYGDDPQLDALWDDCEAGDMEACDELWTTAPIGSDYENFGGTCGNRTTGGSTCTGRDLASAEPSDDASSDEPNAYGDDPQADALWDACAGGDMGACDDLYFQAPSGSQYEEFGDTCGHTTEGGAICKQ